MEELFRRHTPPAEEMRTVPGAFVNWLGLKTRPGNFTLSGLDGHVKSDLPLGEYGDGVYGGPGEYSSVLSAIESRANDERFVAVELGAAWGPWISAVGVVCRRLGIAKTVLVGVEAKSISVMEDHMRLNGLLDDPRIECRLIQGAVWTSDTTLFFPAADLTDHGAAASVEATSVDYRNHPARHVQVPAYALTTICNGLGTIDYMHWDIQGAEKELAPAFQDLLNERVRNLFIGTHSRPIEGDLIRFFYRNGWDILHHQPCEFEYNRHIPSIEGMNKRDGEIFARNPKLA